MHRWHVFAPLALAACALGTWVFSPTVAVFTAIACAGTAGFAAIVFYGPLGAVARAE